MLYTTPTYTLHDEAIKLPSSFGERLGEKSASKLFLRTIGGGNANNLISSDYNKLYSLLRALHASVCSRLFRVYNLKLI